MILLQKEKLESLIKKMKIKSKIGKIGFGLFLTSVIISILVIVSFCLGYKITRLYDIFSRNVTLFVLLLLPLICWLIGLIFMFIGNFSILKGTSKVAKNILLKIVLIIGLIIEFIVATIFVILYFNFYLEFIS